MAKVTLREAQFNERDLSGIWNVLRQVLAVPFASCSFTDFVEIYRHKYLNNPARSADHVFGWVLESPTDGIVGFVGLVPVRMQIGRREITGACGTSHAVLPAYRSYSVSLYKQLTDWGNRYFLLDTTSGAAGNKLHTHLRLGMTKIPVANLDRMFLWLIWPEVLIKWMLNNSTWRKWSALVAHAPCAMLLKAGARARFSMHRRLRFPGAALPVEPLKEFTDEFTQFWDAHKHEYGVTTIRDRVFLQWRHIEVPTVIGRTNVFVQRDNGQLRGYLTLMERNRLEGFCPGHFKVTDVFYDRSRPEVMFSLMNHAYKFAKAQGCSLFEVSKVSEDLAALLRLQRPYMHEAGAWPYWYKASTTELADRCQSDTWWPSAADGDSNL